MSRRRAPNETASLRSTEASQTARPSGSGSFLEARNLAITDGQFNSVQGHHANVVINLNQNPPTQSPLRPRFTNPPISSHGNTRSPLPTYRSQTNTSRGGRTRVPENFASSQLPVQQSNIIYQRHLELKGRGFPLWIPPSNQNLPIQYRRTGVRIGDVGIITPDGGFSFLFNICLPHDDPVNPRVLPEQFSPIFPPIEATSIDKFLVFGHGSHLASASIEKAEANSQFPGFQFESSASEGAILTMPLGATSESLGDIAKFRRYAASNIFHWYKFVNGTLGREAKNGDIRLVVGCDKTTTWGIATFANQSRQNSCRLRFGPPAALSSDSISSNSSRYVWEYSGIADVRAGPSPGENNGLSQADDPGDVVYENQCLFLRTLNPTLHDDIWSDIHKLSSVDLQLQGDLHPAKSLASTASLAKRTSTTKNKPSTLSSHTSGNRRCLDPHPQSQTNIIAFDGKSVIFDSGPLSALINHPSKTLNDILMTKVPAAHMVITHDEDWSFIASRYDTFPDPHELLEQMLVSHCICVEDGVIFLDRREAIRGRVSNAQELVPENLGAKALSASQTLPQKPSYKFIPPPRTASPSSRVSDVSSLMSSADRAYEDFPLPTRHNPDSVRIADDIVGPDMSSKASSITPRREPQSHPSCATDYPSSSCTLVNSEISDDDTVFSISDSTRSSVVGWGLSPALSLQQKSASNPSKPLFIRSLPSDFAYHAVPSQVALTKQLQILQNEWKPALAETKTPRYSYVGPSLDAADELVDEDLEFEKFKMRTRMEKIVEFHKAAALAEISLSAEIYEGRKQLKNSKEEDVLRVLEHQKWMMQLRTEKEEEMKAIIGSERARRRSDFGRHLTREAVEELPSETWGLTSFQEKTSLDLRLRFKLDALRSADYAKQQRNVESLSSELFADGSQPHSEPNVSSASLFNNYASVLSNQDVLYDALIPNTQGQLRQGHPSMSRNTSRSNSLPKLPRRTLLSSIPEFKEEEVDRPAEVINLDQDIGWEMDEPKSKAATPGWNYATAGAWDSEDVRSTPVSGSWGTKAISPITEPYHDSSIWSDPELLLDLDETEPEPTVNPFKRSKAATTKKPSRVSASDKLSVMLPIVETLTSPSKTFAMETPVVSLKVDKPALAFAPTPDLAPIGKKKNNKQRQANKGQGVLGYYVA